MCKILECDVDGVLFDIWTPVENRLQYENIDFKFDRDVCTYSMRETGERRKRLLELLLSADIRKEADFFQGADDFVSSLYEFCKKNDMRLLLNTHELYTDAAVVKGSRIAGLVRRTGIACDVNITVGGVKRMPSSFVVIDDCMDNLLLSPAICRILFDRFHNRSNSDVTLQYRNNILRGYSYDSILDILVNEVLIREKTSV